MMRLILCLIETLPVSDDRPMPNPSETRGTGPSEARPVPVYVLPSMPDADEISLLDIWQALVRHRKAFWLTVATVVLVTALVLALIPPRYKATAYLLPPAEGDLIALRARAGGVPGLDPSVFTPEAVYAAFQTRLKSRGELRRFFDRNHLAEHYNDGEVTDKGQLDELFDKAFYDRLSIENDKKQEPLIRVSLSDTDPAFTARQVNALVESVDRKVADQLVRTYRSAIEAQIARLRDGAWPGRPARTRLHASARPS